MIKANSESPLLEFQNVTRLYGDVIGVNDISISIPRGVYGLLGPNGSGKTTLINLIMAQLRPSVGRLKVLGTDPASSTKYLRKIGLCPATDVYNPILTGRQWVRFQVALYGYSLSEAYDRADQALKLVKMEESWNRPMANYSLGMRQRCKLAQAIAHDPELLILDEPFNGLDPGGRYEMTDYLKDWASKGKSLLVSSHLLHEVEAIKCSFLLITGGRLLASGDQQEVRQMLNSVPNKVRIKSPDYRLLASQLALKPCVSRLSLQHESSSLLAETPSTMQFGVCVNQIVKEHKLRIQEIQPEDNSLQSLFSIIMQIHRGER